MYLSISDNIIRASGKFLITADKWIDTIYPLLIQGWQEM